MDDWKGEEVIGLLCVLPYTVVGGMDPGRRALQDADVRVGGQICTGAERA